MGPRNSKTFSRNRTRDSLRTPLGTLCCGSRRPGIVDRMQVATSRDPVSSDHGNSTDGDTVHVEQAVFNMQENYEDGPLLPPKDSCKQISVEADNQNSVWNPAWGFIPFIDALDIFHDSGRDDLDSYVDDDFGYEGFDTVRVVPKHTPLMVGARNQTEAVEHFVDIFRKRFGETSPCFFVGSLQDAIEETRKSPTENKMLAIYLHNEDSVHSNIFVTEILQNEGVINVLSSHFVTWAWDVTSEENRNRFETIINSSGIYTEDFVPNHPCILLVRKTTSPDSSEFAVVLTLTHDSADYIANEMMGIKDL